MMAYDLDGISEPEMAEIISKQEQEINDLEERFFLLTGCRYYGRIDGDAGCCIDCAYDNNDLWHKCCDFSDEFYIYMRKKEKECITTDSGAISKEVEEF